MFVQILSISNPIWQGFSTVAKESGVENPIAYLDENLIELKPGAPYVTVVERLMGLNDSGIRHFHLAAAAHFYDLISFLRASRLKLRFDIREERKFELIFLSGNGEEWLDTWSSLRNCTEPELVDFKEWIRATFSRLGFQNYFE